MRGQSVRLLHVTLLLGCCEALRPIGVSRHRRRKGTFSVNYPHVQHDQGRVLEPQKQDFHDRQQQKQQSQLQQMHKQMHHRRAREKRRWQMQQLAPPQPQQTLFRHRFVVSQDFCIRMPLDAPQLLQSLMTHDDLSGYIELQLEAFRPLSKVRWSPDSQRMLRLPNAGGSSIISEVLAFELLARTLGASLDKTELELEYAHASKMTDFAITVLGGYSLGVSVTRAYKWHGPKIDPGTVAHSEWPRCSRHEPAGLHAEEARRLLIKKLLGIQESSQAVVNHSWRKQVLVVFTFSHGDAALLEREYRCLPSALRANTVLVVTRTDGVQWIW
jgi:hypothetical protein